MDLFEECMEALGKNAKILDEKVAENILSDFDKNFPLTNWGRIDWNKVKNKKEINTFEEIFLFLKNENKKATNPVYVIGSNVKIPLFEGRLYNILENFYDVEAVSPNTWLYCPEDGWVIELYHEGEITIGFV